MTGVRDGTYARSSALFDRAERSLEVCLHPYTSFEFALHDLTLLDGTMAHLAELMGLAINDYDTVGVGDDRADEISDTRYDTRPPRGPDSLLWRRQRRTAGPNTRRVTHSAGRGGDGHRSHRNVHRTAGRVPLR